MSKYYHYNVDSTVLCALIIRMIQAFGGEKEEAAGAGAERKKDTRTNKFDLLWSCMGLKGFNNNLELYAGVKNRMKEDKNSKYLRKPGWICTTAEMGLLKNRRQQEVSALDVYFADSGKLPEGFEQYGAVYPAFCPEDENKVTLGKLFYTAFGRLEERIPGTSLKALMEECLAEWKVRTEDSPEVLASLRDAAQEEHPDSCLPLAAVLIRNAERNCIRPLGERALKTLNIERVKLDSRKDFAIVAELNIQEELYLGEIWDSFSGETNGCLAEDAFAHLRVSEDDLPANVRNLDSRALPNLKNQKVIVFDVSQTSALTAVYGGAEQSATYYRLPVPEVPLSSIYPGHCYIRREAAAETFRDMADAFIRAMGTLYGDDGFYLMLSVRGRVTPDRKVILNDNILGYVLADASLSELFHAYRSRLIVMNNGSARVAAERIPSEKRSVACVSVKNGIGLGYMDENHRIFTGEGGAGCELGDCPYDSRYNLEEALRAAVSGGDPAYSLTAVLCHALRYVTYLMAPRTIFLLDLTPENSVDMAELRREFLEGNSIGGRKLAEGYHCELLSASFGEFQAVIGCLKAADLQLEGGGILI